MGRYYLVLIMIWLCLAAPGLAESIYSWTEEDGTKRFSNTPPPEGVKVYQKKAVSSEKSNNDSSEKRRSSYDRMVRHATSESQRLEQERQKVAAAKADERKRQADARNQDQLEAQRKQLQAKIEALKKRGYSPTYTKGMQKAQIEKIRQQIEELNDSSESSPTQK